MAISLLDIRYILERESVFAENPSIIDWCNFCNSDVGVKFNIPSTAQIIVDTVTLKYPEPVGLKQINRLWMQSDFNNGIYKEFKVNYRRYNGFLWFERPFSAPDTLNIDFYKDMKVFANITDTIDFEDRYHPVYVYFSKMKYFMQQQVPGHATRYDYYMRVAEVNNVKTDYMNMKNELISYYSMKNPDYFVEERW